MCPGFSCYSFTIKQSINRCKRSITAGKSELESWHGTLKSWTSSYEHSTRAACCFFHCLPTCPTHLSLYSCLTEQQCSWKMVTVIFSLFSLVRKFTGCCLLQLKRISSCQPYFLTASLASNLTFPSFPGPVSFLFSLLRLILRVPCRLVLRRPYGFFSAPSLSSPPPPAL